METLTSIFVDLRYRTDSYGNSYSAALIWIDGQPRHITSLYYGANHGYQEAAKWLEQQGYVNLHGYYAIVGAQRQLREQGIAMYVAESQMNKRRLDAWIQYYSELKD